MPINLDQSNVSLDDPKFTTLLTELQANILKHHGRKFAYHIFVEIDKSKTPDALKWISDFAKNRITSAKKQLEQAKVFEESRIDGGALSTLSLSSFGYSKLGFDVSKPDDANAKPFVDGMKNSAGRLKDNVDEWEDDFKNNKIDFLITLADSNSKNINSVLVQNLKAEIQLFSKRVFIQRGRVLKNEHRIGIEHFGYVDGVSQPLFLKKENDLETNNQNWKDIANLEIALVHDPGGKEDNSFGSFLVFRKLEQNVKAFKEAEDNLQKILDDSTNPNSELSGAMLVGRFRDGTEVINHSNAQNITQQKDLNNDFDYANDPIDSPASKCPFHSHIRVTNPRKDISESFVKSRRIVRRGIPYDDIGREDDLTKNPTNGVGLLFMCYQSNIKDQFEFLQSEWANDGIIRPRNVGQDSIIGQGVNNFQKDLPNQWGTDNPRHNFNFGKFVNNKGGEYFFTPSISFLKSLHKDIDTGTSDDGDSNGGLSGVLVTVSIAVLAILFLLFRN